jgi:hypothetical protein
MVLELSDDEAAALARHLRQALNNHRYPLAPRLDPLKSVLAKLEPPTPPTSEPPLRPLTPDMAPSHGRGRRRR